MGPYQIAGEIIYHMEARDAESVTALWEELTDLVSEDEALRLVMRRREDGAAEVAYVTAQEAARLTGWSYAAIIKWLNNGRLEGRKEFGRWIVPVEALPDHKSNFPF